jgi:hypothetical protein
MSWAVSIGKESNTFAAAYEKQLKLAFIYVKESTNNGMLKAVEWNALVVE